MLNARGDHCLLLVDHDGATAEIITGLFWERLNGEVELKHRTSMIMSVFKLVPYKTLTLANPQFWTVWVITDSRTVSGPGCKRAKSPLTPV